MMKAKWELPDPLGPCICSQLRRTARIVSSLYDQVLSDLGLTVTQHSLLVNIARLRQTGRSELASQLGMDRTTLTRNLKPLERLKLIIAAESADRRERLLQLSPEGKRILQRSYLLWEQAQRELSSELNSGELKKLRESLAAVEKAAESVK